MQGLTTLITVTAIMGGVFILISSLSYLYSLRQIKNKTAGNGQHGTARWASSREIHKTYKVVPFEPKTWRRDEKSRPTEQGIVVGCESQGNETLALVDSGDVHCMMIGAAGVGKTAYWLYPNIEYACASGMSFLSTDTKGDIMRNYGSIAEKYYGYRISVIDLRNPMRSHGNNLLHLVNKYMDLYAETNEVQYSSLGAGDQGTVYGYATNETEEMLPMPLVLAHNICREIDIQKREHRLRGVMPDGKAQVTVEYENGKAKRIKTVVVSVQHSWKKPIEELEDEILNDVLPAAIIERFDLKKPIYKKTSAYGHFNSREFPWEAEDAIQDILTAERKRNSGIF